MFFLRNFEVLPASLKILNENERRFCIHTSRENYKLNYITISPRSVDPIYIVNYYINWVDTSWTSSISIFRPTNLVSSTACKLTVVHATNTDVYTQCTKFVVQNCFTIKCVLHTKFCIADCTYI